MYSFFNVRFSKPRKIEAAFVLYCLEKLEVPYLIAELSRSLNMLLVSTLRVGFFLAT